MIALSRPKPQLPSPERLRALIDGEGLLALRATPGADRDALIIVGDKLSVRVRAAPEDGKANEAVCALVAKALGVPQSKVEVLRGTSAREKMLRVPPP